MNIFRPTYNHEYWIRANRIQQSERLVQSLVLPNTGTRLVPEYLCLIPEQCRCKDIIAVALRTAPGRLSDGRWSRAGGTCP